jgi:PKD repeat protein
MVFGVEDNATLAAVRAELARKGIPASAYRVEITPAIHPMSDNLRSRHRPTVGGIQIHWGQYVCTLGFNVDHADGRSFITNSHCTNHQGSTGTTAYFQPSSSVDATAIAIEADDPAYTRLAGCSRGKVCRYSDAARALYQSGTESTRGSIAKATGENNGSLVVNGAFTVTAQNNSSTSFSGTVHKVGRTTGWSSGNVTNTCATVNVSGSNIQLLCQTLVQRSGSIIVQGGDSGSPVFQRLTGDNVELVGILWGGSSGGDLFVFSPLKNIRDELGAMTATSGGGGDPTPPPSDQLQASFTYNCGNGDTCHFTDTSTGGPTAWSWDFTGGNPSSAPTPNASTRYNSAGDKLVTLEVSRDGATHTTEQTITCRQQGPNLRCR